MIRIREIDHLSAYRMWPCAVIDNRSITAAGRLT
jgi:hypothetical protein